MRIGVVSDTHNNLKNCRRIVQIFNDAGVDAVVHTGDITQGRTLAVFAALAAPLYGVFGNNDQERDGLTATAQEYGFHFQDPPLDLAWSNRRIVVVHDPRDLQGTLTPEHDLALHGHTHMLRIERQDPQQGSQQGSREGCQLIFNPGECAGHMVGLNAVGIVDLDTLEPRLLHF